MNTTARALTGKQAWAVVFGLVIAHELTCAEGQLLSEEVDRALAKHPVLVYGFTLLTVAHLLNWLPNRFDPYTVFGSPLSRLKGSK